MPPTSAHPGASRTVAPAEALTGRVRVPGDKSIAHRALIFAGLAPVPVTLAGVPDGADVGRTRVAMARLGAWFRSDGPGRWRVEGLGAPGVGEPDGVIDCGNAGTTMRLLAGLVAGAAHTVVLTGDRSLRARPMARIVRPLRAMGATVLARGGDRFAPLAIRGGALRGRVHDGAVASAQVKSALLLAGLRADGELEVREPHPSRDHTERMLAWWGVELTCAPGRVRMAGGQPLIPPSAEPSITIPGDLSSAAFLLVAAAMLPGSELTVEGVGINPTRAGVLDALAQMGAEPHVEPVGDAAGEPVADVTVRGPERLEPFHVDGSLLVRCIDEIPALAVAATRAHGRSTIRDAGELRHKESDRLQTTCAGLAALGARVEEFDDGLAVDGGEPLRGGTASAGGDHRLAMAMSIAGLSARAPVTVEGAGWVDVSWPGFHDTLTAVARRTG